MSERVPLSAVDTVTLRRRGRKRKYGIVASTPSQSESPATPVPADRLPLPHFLTPEQAAEVLGVSAHTIRSRCAEGKLPAVDLGDGGNHLWRIYRDRLFPDGDSGVGWKDRALRAEAKVAAAMALLEEEGG